MPFWTRWSRTACSRCSYERWSRMTCKASQGIENVPFMRFNEMAIIQPFCKAFVQQDIQFHFRQGQLFWLILRINLSLPVLLLSKYIQQVSQLLNFILLFEKQWFSLVVAHFHYIRDMFQHWLPALVTHNGTMWLSTVLVKENSTLDGNLPLLSFETERVSRLQSKKAPRQCDPAHHQTKNCTFQTKGDNTEYMIYSPKSISVRRGFPTYLQEYRTILISC